MCWGHYLRPSAFDRRPARNLNATTRSRPGSASRAARASSFGRRPRRLRRKPICHRRRRREAKSDEDRDAYGEDRFATGEDEEKRRVTKTEAPTAKTGSPQAKTKRSEERRRPGHLGRRPGCRLRTRRPQGKASESKRFESREGNLIIGPMSCNGPNRQKRLGCNLPNDIKIRLYPGNIPGI
ncbi:hypothetical protein PVAP13_6NG114403 [Panicum virgatum]|uniref:Uncharacterized protein n=1 Tax=Panicum virgatum TaxID=38727 RepID=A0A8T0R185_PANVG|nr:hypothetical protein PVAP13_6NG114403 [Panicum virgatum]